MSARNEIAHVQSAHRGRIEAQKRRPLAMRVGRMSLAVQFLIASLGILVVGMLVIGLWAAGEIRDGVLNRTAASTGLYVNSIVAPYLQTLVSGGELPANQIARLDSLLAETPLGDRIVAFKVWSPSGTVLYSPNHDLIGRWFPPDRELMQALQGKLAADVSDLQDSENEYERQHWRRLVQVYIPVRQQGESRTIAVTEFYQLPDELDRQVLAERLRAWAVVAGIMLLMYVTLAGIVKRGSDTIQSQQRSLSQKVGELSDLLDQNSRLHRRVLHAASRTTALNEQTLRRIGADLHDGPGQALGLALLRMGMVQERFPADSVGDLKTVERAVREALQELRAISGGLRLPELESLSLQEVFERAVHDHERLSGTHVQAEAGPMPSLPQEAPLAVKIALFRSLQEALSNATRHGGGNDVAARVWSEDGVLWLTVSDSGPGFPPEEVQPDGHLGLAGMRERAELLGGSFGVHSTGGQGTIVTVCWPLAEAKRT